MTANEWPQISLQIPSILHTLRRVMHYVSSTICYNLQLTNGQFANINKESHLPRNN